MSSATADLVGWSEAPSADFHLLGISGSLRKRAYSTALLEAIAEATPAARFDYADIGALPHFNQDIYDDALPDAVDYFRRQILAADGLIVSSTEYNHGMPGVLKNAFDWASRPHNFSPLAGKPVLIMTSSPAFTGGVRAQYQLRETLISALARPVATPEIVVGAIGAKMVGDRFEDQTTIEFGRIGVAALFKEIMRARAV